MRKTREELLQDFPSWNEKRHDIVKTLYGDEISWTWDENRYKEYEKATGTCQNIEAIDAYIYTIYGKFHIYNTLIGRIGISDDGNVLFGNIKIKYNGFYHDITLNLMYGWKALDILRISHTGVVGFSNKDGQGSPTIHTKEMNKDLIEKLINNPLEDYGISIQKFMSAVRELYNEDTKNYILEKLKKNKK